MFPLAVTDHSAKASDIPATKESPIKNKTRNSMTLPFSFTGQDG
jgi:hypothetical protein